MKRIVLCIVSLCLSFSLAPAFANEPGFARGYAQALLDQSSGDLGLEARITQDAGTIEIAGEQCLSPQERQTIAQQLTGAGPIIKVQWQLNCPQPEAPVVAKASTGLVWLPTTEIFRAPQADPREPQLALKYQQYQTRGQHITIGAVQAGETFSLVEGSYGEGTWQIGLQGGIFSIFNQDKESNDLTNTDYIVGLPVSYRKGNWSGRVRLFHQSSHLGDEFILNENINQRLDISFEALDVLVSHDWEQLRLYGGGGYLVRTTENLDRGLLQGGGEWRINNVIGELDLSLGANFKALDAQDWTINQAYQSALIFSRNKREIRLLLEYYHGKSFNGEFFLNRLEYFGLGVQFGI
jgi:hypothetical protein